MTLLSSETPSSSSRTAIGSPCGWCRTAAIHPVDGSTMILRHEQPELFDVPIPKDPGNATMKTVSKNDESSSLSILAKSELVVSKTTMDPTMYDVTEAVNWMAYLERTEGREDDEGGAGAYDTLRCDVVVDMADSNAIQPRVVIWGQDFHLQRLERSYMSLVRRVDQQQAQPVKEDGAWIPPSPGVTRENVQLKQAVHQSKDIITKLLDEAVSNVIQGMGDNTAFPSYSGGGTYFFLVKVTLLWSPPAGHSRRYGSLDSSNVHDPILVRGHATSTFRPMYIYHPPDPIVVSIAAHRQSSDGLAIHQNTSLPNRFHEDDENKRRDSNPQSKVASWCRRRQQLEQPTYKPHDVSEVLMIRTVPINLMRKKTDDNEENHNEAIQAQQPQPQQQPEVLEVLEGLSSNFFVIHKDGSLRTATDGVLFGYIRHLVLESATKVGLTIDPRPVYLHESDQWKECFITSSSRLIWPIRKIVIPRLGSSSSSTILQPPPSFDEHWKYGDESTVVGKSVFTSLPKWYELWKEILKAGGYEE